MTLILCYVWVECRFILLCFFSFFLKTSQFHDKHNEIFNVHHKQQSFNSFNKRQFNSYHFFSVFVFQMMFHSFFLVLFIFKIDISFLFHSEWFHIHISFSNYFLGDLTIHHFKFQNMSFIHFQSNQNEFCCWIKQHKTHFIIEINCSFNWIKEFEMEI